MDLVNPLDSVTRPDSENLLFSLRTKIPEGAPFLAFFAREVGFHEPKLIGLVTQKITSFATLHTSLFIRFILLAWMFQPNWKS
jgi:hypothetical protein